MEVKEHLHAFGGSLKWPLGELQFWALIHWIFFPRAWRLAQREAARIPFYTCAHIYYKYEQVNMLHFRFLDHS